MMHTSRVGSPRHIALLAAAGLALTLGACSSDGDQSAPSTPTSASSTASRSVSSAVSSATPVPAETSMGISASRLAATVTSEQQHDLTTLLSMSPPTDAAGGRGGSSASFVLAPGGIGGPTGQVSKVKVQETITAACLGASVAVPVVVTLTPDSSAPKKTVSKRVTCPAGEDQGYGVKVYEGEVRGPAVKVTSKGSKPVAFAVGFLQK